MKVPPSSKNQRSRKESKAPKNDSSEIRPNEKSKKSAESQQVCAACLFQISSASQDYCSTECSHHYHEKCLEQWLKQKNTCCLCRQKIKKYSTKTKGQIVVPERVERRSFFDLLIPFESIDNQLDFPDIVFYHSERHPWILLSNNHVTYQHRPNFRNHFIFSIGGSSSQNLNEEERPVRVVESDNSQEVAASRRVDSQPFETAQNNNRSQAVVEVAQRARPRRKIVRKSNKTSKRVTRSSTKKSSSKNNPRQAKPKSQAKTLKKNKAVSRK